MIVKNTRDFIALIWRTSSEPASADRSKLRRSALHIAAQDSALTRLDELLNCPWHGWEFDAHTRQSWRDPENTYVRQYAVSVESGGDLLKGPYVVDIFQVSVEKNCIIAEM
jgi:3-phenylpropionate/trans-cinnamate dioxygenase ferredoxin subunit